MAQHSCQVSFKSMQGCRRSWEDTLKCVKILSVKGHNSAKICRTWITSSHSNPCKDVGGVQKTNFDGTDGRKDGMTEWRTKQTLNAPLPFYGGGHKNKFLIFKIHFLVFETRYMFNCFMFMLKFIFLFLIKKYGFFNIRNSIFYMGNSIIISIINYWILEIGYFF